MTRKKQNTKPSLESTVCYESLESWVRGKIQGLIQGVLEEEVTEFLGRRRSVRVAESLDAAPGYRNGYGKQRKVGLLGGTIEVRRPRVRSTQGRFESKILPLFKRRSKELGQMLPELYLHGLAQGDFELALRGLLGEGAPLSSSSIGRLKAQWQSEYEEWKEQDLSSVQIVYQWADGLYVKAGIADDKAALLVIVGAKADGQKVVLCCESGQRESKESWKEVLRDLQRRGLKLGRVTVADGHLGIWSALGELHPTGEEQRCWNHKMLNVLDALPKRERAQARQLLSKMAYAATRQECERRRDQFVSRYERNYPKATGKLLRDWDRLVTFYSFPKEHWTHLRTSNIVESPFAAIRLRTDAARRYKRVENATAMIWKLLKVAEQAWRRLKGHELLAGVCDGKRFENGLPVEKKSEATECAA